MRPWYLYLEIFPNGKTYVGISVDPAHRHRQHIGELRGGRGGVWPITNEIRRSKSLPTMYVLAICSAGKGDRLDDRWEAEQYEEAITLNLIRSGREILTQEYDIDVIRDALEEGG